MYVIELLLPLYDNDGKRLPKKLYASVRKQLVKKFGGMTAHSQAPVKGLWKDKGHTEKDELVIFEVMSARLERGWWTKYRRELERTFRQKELVVRAHKIRRL